MKGKEKRKGKETETCSRASTNNFALILTRVIFLCVGFGAKLTLTAGEEDDNPFTTTVIMQKNQQRTQNHISIEFLLNGCP